MKNFDNNRDALHVSILYIYLFLFSQLRDATISREDFLMVENDYYEQFSWRESMFDKLMTTRR